jgi:hypothetical protein
MVHEFNSVGDVAALEPRANTAIGEATCVYGRYSNHCECVDEALGVAVAVT